MSKLKLQECSCHLCPVQQYNHNNNLIFVIVFGFVQHVFGSFKINALECSYLLQGSPCHLYFDLEFDRLANHGLDGNLLVDALLSKVAETLHDVYSLEYDQSWTMELDSTTTGKNNILP
jgi:hypothetical protein